MRFVILFAALLSLNGCGTIPEQANSSISPCATHPDTEFCYDVTSSRFSGLTEPFIPYDFPHDTILISFDKSAHAKFELPYCDLEVNPSACRLSAEGRVLIDFSAAAKHLSPRFRESFAETLLEQPKNMFVASMRSANLQSPFSYSVVGETCQQKYEEGAGNDSVLQRCTLSAIDQLAQAVANQLATKRYTHVVVFSTGWNTRPSASPQFYSEALESMQKVASDEDEYFEPLLIGLTWPSGWRIPVLSLLNKARDADELGHIWVNYLINQALPRAVRSQGASRYPRAKLSVFGHSLGGRIMATAAVSGGYVSWLDREQRGRPDHVVLLQPAFSGSRMYLDPALRGSQLSHAGYYQDLAPSPGTVVSTSSKDDLAVKIPIFADRGNAYFSTDAAWDFVCGVGGMVQTGERTFWAERFLCEKGSLPEEGVGEERGLILLSLDDTISEHNDVRNKRVFRALWPVLSTSR